MFFVSCVSHAFASVHCCLVVTCWERADHLLALAGDVYCIFITFPLIVSFPNLCHLSYFASYLSNRKQRVVIPGACSEWVAIAAGVPQGLILGPFLFLIYINDIIGDIHSHIRLFADDTSLYIIVDDPFVAAVKL